MQVVVHENMNFKLTSPILLLARTQQKETLNELIFDANTWQLLAAPSGYSIWFSRQAMTYTLFLHGEFTEKENRFSYGYIGLGSGREYKLESTSRCFTASSFNSAKTKRIL